jgi:fatty acid desaturase
VQFERTDGAVHTPSEAAGPELPPTPTWSADEDDATPPGPTAAEVRASLKHLRGQVRNDVFVLKIAICGVLIAGGGVLALSSSWWERIPGILLLGCMFAHAAELQHQALHNTGFRKQRANTISGIALGVPMVISFAAYRASHLRHHRYLGTPMNAEFFDYGDQYGAAGKRSRAAALLSWLIRFSMAHHYRQFAVSLGRSLLGRDFDGENPTISRRIRRDHLIILSVLTAMTAASVALGQALVLWLWLAPLVLVAGPVHALIELPEHFQCETLSLDPFANTRTIRSNRLMVWFTNGNNFHVEHHLMPNLPIEQLTELHAEVKDRLRYFHPGYADYFSRLLKRMPPVRDAKARVDG